MPVSLVHFSIFQQNMVEKLTKYRQKYVYGILLVDIVLQELSCMQQFVGSVGGMKIIIHVQNQGESTITIDGKREC